MSTAYLRHRDASGRLFIGEDKDTATEKYIRPSDGRLVPLFVQEADDKDRRTGLLKGWTRTGKMRLQTSPIIGLVHWTYSSILIEGSEERQYDDGATLSLLIKWVPSSIILVIMLLIPQDLEGSIRNNGFYDPIRYRDWGYSKVSRNAAEDRNQMWDRLGEPGEGVPLLSADIEMTLVDQRIGPGAALERELDEDYDDMPAQHFRPRYLCFLREDSTGQTYCETRKVTEWTQEYGDNADTDFIFLSYTRKQFCVATEQELSTWDLPDERTRAAYISISKQDRQRLLAYGVEAARSAGKVAFWLDFQCIRDADNQAKASSQSEDVYRISDIVRAAHSLVILVGPPITSRISNEGAPEYSPANMKEWLQEWGTRLWTLPEILLCSPEHRPKIYAIGGPSKPEQLARRNFAAHAWKDAKLVRQLVDHYESSIHLTPLELVSIALECFASRQTDQFNRGDIAYALMGLLRRRPPVNKSDSSFEAFARLSLVNDSDALLERLLCMMPMHRDAPWHQIKDAWGARLWDIEPRCQIAGIVDDQTVTLDGAFGATIQWDSMDPVAFFKRPTLARIIGKILLRGSPVYLIMALILTIAGGVLMQSSHQKKIDSEDAGSSEGDSLAGNTSKNMALGILIPGIIFLIPSAIITLAAPAMLLDIYRGKFWSTQALFIGVEGMVDIGEAERHLFGFNHGRLKWSTNGSTLSRHHYVNGECVALPPAAKTSEKEDARGTLFTLIDTYSMTATCFYAEQPPVAVIICGQEGGMQRAVLCSYDWTRQTFARETVIRVKTLVLDRMLRVDRFRFALKRHAHEEGAELHGSNDGNHALLGRTAESYGAGKFWPLMKVDLVLLPIMWFLSSDIARAPASNNVGKLQAAWYGGLLVALVPCTIFINRLQLGLVLAVAILVFGALNIGYIYMPQETTYPGGRDIGINFVFGVVAGLVLPSFVFLTGAWYTAKEQAMRILLWGFCTILIDDVIREIYTATLSDYTFVVFYAIHILLAGASFILLKAPGQAGWLQASERTYFSRRHEDWTTTPWKSKEIPTLLKKPQIWFFFAASLFTRAVTTAVNVQPVLENFHMIWAIDVPAIFLALLLGVAFVRFSGIRLHILAFAMTLQLAAGITLVYSRTDEGEYNPINYALIYGMWFLIVTGSIVPYLIWSLALSSTHNLTSRLTIITATFSGYGIGGLLGGAYFIAVRPAEDSDLRSLRGVRGIWDIVAPDQVPGYLAFVCTFYGLALVIFALWYVYNRRVSRREVQEGTMGERQDVEYERPLVAVSEPSQRGELSFHGGEGDELIRRG